MNIRKIIKEIILEDVADSAKIKGADADTALARGEYLRDKAMQNLSDLGVYGAKGHMASLGIFDKDYLSKSGPFGFSFTSKNGKKYSGKAKYDKGLSDKENTIVLSFKSDEPVCFDEKNCYGFFKIKFDPESTHRAYTQKVKREVPKFWKKVQENSTLQGLQEGYVFDVVIIPYGTANVKKARYGRSFKKGLAGQQTKMNFPENYSSQGFLLSEANGEIIKTQIKIDKINLKKPSSEGFGESDELSDTEFTKVEGKINIEGDKIKTLFDETVVAKIDSYLRKGIFYAIISKKTKNTLILSDSKTYDKNSEYLLIQSSKPIDTSNPNSWRGVEVRIGKNAMGRDEFPENIKGKIGYLKIVD